jgi:hypothetical protein
MKSTTTTNVLDLRLRRALLLLLSCWLSFGYSALLSPARSDHDPTTTTTTDITISRRRRQQQQVVRNIPSPAPPIDRRRVGSRLFTPTSVPVRFPIPVGSCNICDTYKPRNLTLQYTLPSQTSKIQKSFATCIKSDKYPKSGILTLQNKTSIPIEQGTIFTLGGKIHNKAVFTISQWGSCNIDTSCYTPLVVGDQIGPFRVLAGNDCTGTKLRYRN